MIYHTPCIVITRRVQRTYDLLLIHTYFKIRSVDKVYFALSVADFCLENGCLSEGSKMKFLLNLLLTTPKNDPEFMTIKIFWITAKRILERLEIQTSSLFVKISLFLNLKPFFIFFWRLYGFVLLSSIWEKATSILAGNLNSGPSYLITAVPRHCKSFPSN